jgi:DNA-binding MarR family transcriptional regulator
VSAPCRYDELVAARLGINRTDLRCLDLLHETGTMSAGQLAVGSGLTTGATTRMLDRLERIGYIRRLPDRDDRRRVLVELTPQARGLASELYGSFEAAGASLRRYHPDQLALLRDFLEGVVSCTNGRRPCWRRPRCGRKARTSCSAIRFSGIPRFAISLSDAGHYLPHASASSQVWR